MSDGQLLDDMNGMIDIYMYLMVETNQAKGWIGNHLSNTRSGLDVNFAIVLRGEMNDLLVFSLDGLEVSIIDSKQLLNLLITKH
jgi:hypothetical protein